MGAFANARPSLRDTTIPFGSFRFSACQNKYFFSSHAIFGVHTVGTNSSSNKKHEQLRTFDVKSMSLTHMYDRTRTLTEDTFRSAGNNLYHFSFYFEEKKYSR